LSRNLVWPLLGVAKCITLPVRIALVGYLTSCARYWFFFRSYLHQRKAAEALIKPVRVGNTQSRDASISLPAGVLTLA
jgi:hypothetical protein